MLPSEQDLQQDVFERLSTLDQLATLVMFIPQYDNNIDDKNVLEFRLDCGLGYLVTLQHLKGLRFTTLLYGGIPYTPQLGERGRMDGNSLERTAVCLGAVQ